MSDIVLPTEKRRNYPGEISLWCGGLGFMSAFIYLAAKTSHEDSLYTNNVAGFVYCVGGNLWFIFTSLGLLCWLISLFLLLPIWGKRFRATGAVSGILLPLIQTSFVMPTLGLVNPHARVYYRVSDPAATQYLREYIKSEEVIDQKFVKDKYEQDYRKPTWKKYPATDGHNTETIIVKYNLRRGIERNDLPKSFSVVIDRKTKKTTILHDEDM